MKKSNANNKGFAMAELLAISIVILLIFSILISNYLPLVAEFENRVDYTNVTANYASFLVRKVYKAVLEDTTPVEPDTGKTAAEVLFRDLTEEKPYYVVYDQSYAQHTMSPGLLVNERQIRKLNSVIEQYGIEEIVITKYQLTDAKKVTKHDLRNDPDLEGNGIINLYGFIQYLPEYNKSKYGQDGELEEPYRLIVKTKDFGYATTQILPDPPLPYKCFNLSYGKVNGVEGFIINGFSNDTSAECRDKENLIISSGKITKKISGTTRTGYIKIIGANAFADTCKSTKIKMLSLPGGVNGVRVIGDNAFNGCGIKNFSLIMNAPGVTNIGKQAFANNEITQLKLSSQVQFTNASTSSISYGEGAFANNNLKKIELEFKPVVSSNEYNTNIPKNMFTLNSAIGSIEGKNENVALSISDEIENIGNSAFENLKINDFIFPGSSSKLKVIGDSAFANTGISGALTIPNAVTTIGSNAFANTKISSISLSNKVTSIGDSAFANNQSLEYVTLPSGLGIIGASTFENTGLKSITIPDSVNKIGDSAFSGSKLPSIVLPSGITEIGLKAFSGTTIGDSYKDDTKILQIKNKSLFNYSDLWCKALFGTTGCTFNQVTFDADKVNGEYVTSESKSIMLAECSTRWQELGYQSEADCTEKVNALKPISAEDEKYAKYEIYKCSNGDKDKYITYVGGAS